MKLVAPPKIYDIVAARLHVSKDFVKRTVLTLAYGGSVDPWVDRIVMDELLEVCSGR